jgi:hypothetical protein
MQQFAGAFLAAFAPAVGKSLQRANGLVNFRQRGMRQVRLVLP